MFPHISAFLTVALAVAASARMEHRMHIRRQNTTVNECDTGNVQCCNSVQQAANLASFLDIFSYSYDPADSVGIDCTPINIYGAGQGAACQAQTVCCGNNTYSGFINVGCSPFNFN